MIRIVSIAILLVTLVPFSAVGGQARRRPIALASTTDFRGTLDYCWFSYSDGLETGAIDNVCASATDLVVVFPATDYTTSPPAGAAAGKDAVNGDGDVQFTLIDIGADPPNWSFGCYVDDQSTNDVLIQKGTGTDMRIRNTAAHQYSGASGGADISMGAATSDAWHHLAVTYDSANLGADSLKIYIDGTLNTSGNGADIPDGIGVWGILSNAITDASDWQGLAYECWLEFSVVSASDVCKIATNGIAGDATHTPGCTP